MTVMKCIVIDSEGGIFIGESIIMADGSVDWIDANSEQGDKLNNIIHFCIPEPVEVEE